MELALSLGDTPKPFSLLDHHSRSQQQKMKDLGFCMGLGGSKNLEDLHFMNTMREKDDDDDDDDAHQKTEDKKSSSSSSDPPPPLQLDLLPFSPVLRSVPPPPPPSQRSFPWLSKNLIAEMGSQNKPVPVLDVKPMAGVSDHQDNMEETAGGESSPNNSNSGTSSFQMDFSSIFKSSNSGRSFHSRKRDLELATVNLELVEATTESDQKASSRGGGMSDEDENGLTRKKLRLTKEQSAFLEDSFKEHSTLNPMVVMEGASGGDDGGR